MPSIIIQLIGVFILLPLLLMRFYRLESITAVFEADESAPVWIELLPLPLLVLVFLLGGVLIGLHLAEIFTRMNLPKYQEAFLAEVAVLQDYRLFWLLLVPLSAILGSLIYVKRYFGLQLNSS